MKNSIPSFLMILTVLSFSACIKNADNNIVVCEIPVTPEAGFQVVDQSSGQDLFFSATPKYQPKDFYAFKTKDKARRDTIKPRVYTAGSYQVLLLPLDYSKTRDTLIIKVANTPDDQFIYTVKKSTGPCGGSELDKAYFNNTEINGKYVIKK